MTTKVFHIKPENKFYLDPTFVTTYAGTQPNWGYGVLSYVTYKRTYARPLSVSDKAAYYVRFFNLSQEQALKLAETDGVASEEYWQTLVRVVEGVSSVLKQQVIETGQPWSDDKEQKHAQAMFQLMWDFKFTPPGRGLWFVGTEAIEIKGSAAAQNCGFVSTENIDRDFTLPFTTLMDYSMLGVGMGFDLLGAGKVLIKKPEVTFTRYVVEDTREGWIKALETYLKAYVGEGAIPLSLDVSRIRPAGSPIKTFGGTASGPDDLVTLLVNVQILLDARVGSTLTGRDITDLMNMIGKCVVSGNVRRSAEIALGLESDSDFIEMKDPDELTALYEKKREVCDANYAWRKLETEKAVKLAAAATYGVLDPQRISIEREIEALTKEQNKIEAQDPDIVDINSAIERHPLRAYRWASNNSIAADVGVTNYAKLADLTIKNGEPGYVWLDVIRNHGRMIDPPNTKDRRVKGCNPCAEQPLEHMELCCLVETYPTRHATLDEFLYTLKYAYRYAKAITLIPTHNKHTNAVMVRNRRIGTSMAGIIEMYCTLGLVESIRWWDEGYKCINHWDEEYSGWLGVNESIKKTSVKPGGTVPLLVGVEGGMKPPTSRFYMRTMRIDHKSPLIAALVAAGYRVEPDLTSAKTMVAYFPVKNKDSIRTAKEITLWEQALILANLQRYWADNMVSATLTFQPYEAKDIVNVLKAYEGQLKSVSFLPFSEHRYMQAPYIPCTEAEYEEAVAKLSPVTIDGNVVTHDQDEKFCQGGLCEIVRT